MKICHLPFHSPPPMSMSQNISSHMSGTKSLFFFFLLFVPFLGECWNRDLLAERKEGQRRECSGSVSSVWDPDHQQDQHLRPWGYRWWGGTGKYSTMTSSNHKRSHLLHCHHHCLWFLESPYDTALRFSHWWQGRTRTMSSLFALIASRWRFQAILWRSRWKSAGWRRCWFIRWEGISSARISPLLDF